MNANLSQILKHLTRDHSVAALGTIQADGPYVSMVPFALSDDGRSVIVHVSRLAAHTENMERNGNVSVLIAEAEGRGKTAQALARVTVQGQVRALRSDEPEYEAARQAYLQRFPDAAGLFDFPDFSLFLIDITTVRVVGGFAQATTLTPDAFAEAVRDG